MRRKYEPMTPADLAREAEVPTNAQVGFASTVLARVSPFHAALLDSEETRARVEDDEAEGDES